MGLEPTLPHYGCGVLAAGRPVLVVTVGPDGLEPSPTWLRARHAAASTSIPCRVVSRPGWSRTIVGPLKEPALTVELQAWRSLRPEGFEPPPCELKARCAAVTPRPRLVAVSVSATAVRTWWSPSVAREGVEPSFPPYQSGVFNRWTTGLCFICCESGWPDSNRCLELPWPEPASSLIGRRPGLALPRHVGCRSPTSRVIPIDPCGI